MLNMLPKRRVAGYMESSRASSRVGRKGERRDEERGARIVSPGMPAVRGMPLVERSGFRRVVIVISREGVKRERGIECALNTKPGSGSGQHLRIKVNNDVARKLSDQAPRVAVAASRFGPPPSRHRFYRLSFVFHHRL